MEKLIEEMHKSVLYWIRAAYRKRPPAIYHLSEKIAADASPTVHVDEYLRALDRQWQGRFNVFAPRFAGQLASQIAQRSNSHTLAILKQHGLEPAAFRNTRPWNDLMRATISENVELIKSIPEKYLSDVKVTVMRAMQRGIKLPQLEQELQHRYGVTYRRAKLIARDQVNKTTAMMSRARLMEIGVREAIWVHNGAVQHPRHSHLKAGRDQVRFRLDQGWFDPEVQRYVLPGELISCRCVARPILPIG